MDGRIEQAKRGDADALAFLIREHYARVYRFCARRLGDDLAQDAAQETFVTMQRGLRRFKGDSDFGTWLLGIARNHCRNLARKRGRDPLPLEPWFEAPTQDGAGPVEREALRQALASLSEDHREVVLLHEVEGLRYAEIAALLQVPEGTVKSRLHHAFLCLRRHLCD
ncbi:MAG: RNA polymerase sigma factor [Fimbriimonadaceae bacterium]|nr:RNA polymerase sigma factor [Fimbriimonadaceae bacterium]QYK55326.1 MAG: RNA polymerase sigma factor [Fimbriimonadaceae bacterium]